MFFLSICKSHMRAAVGALFVHSLLAAVLITTVAPEVCAQTQVGTITQAGMQPRSVAVYEAGNKVFVADNTTGNVYTYDGTTLAQTNSAAVGTYVDQMVVHEGTARLFAISRMAQKVAVLDATNGNFVQYLSRTYTLTNGSGFDLAVDEPLGKVYALSYQGLVQIDAVTLSETLISGLGGGGAENFAVNAVTHEIFVSRRIPSTLVVVDGITRATNTFSLPGAGGYGVAANWTNNTALIAYCTPQPCVFDRNSNTFTVPSSPLGQDATKAYYNPAGNRYYTSSEVNQITSIIDGATNVRVDLPLRSVTTAAGVRVSTNHVYFAGMNYVGVVDDNTRMVEVLPVTVPSAGGIVVSDVAINQTTGRVYAINDSDAQDFVTVIQDTEKLTRQPIYLVAYGSARIHVWDPGSETGVEKYSAASGTPTEGVGVLPGGGRYFVGQNFSFDQAMLVFAGIGTYARLASINTGSANPRIPVASPDGTRLYASRQAVNDVVVFDLTTNTYLRNIVVGNGPWGMAFTLDGGKLYVANRNTNTVSVIATATDTVTNTITVGSNPYGVAVSPGGKKAYVTNSAAGTVSVINTATDGVIGTITVGAAPHWLAFSPDGNRLYVTNRTSGTVSVIDTATDTVVNTVSGMTNPEGIDVRPDGAFIYVANAAASSPSTLTIITSADLSVRSVTLPSESGNVISLAMANNMARFAGRVSNSSDGAALSGALVRALQSGVEKGTATTNSAGDYSIFNLLPGTYELEVSDTGFTTQNLDAQSVGTGRTEVRDFTLVAVGGNPVAAFTASPNPCACDQTVNFNASASYHEDAGRTIVSYVWDFGDGTNGTGINPSHSFTHYGTFTVTLTVTDNNNPPKTDTVSHDVSVNLGNQAPIAQHGGPYTAVIGSSVQLNGSNSVDPNASCGDGILSYEWDLDSDGSVDLTGATPTVTAVMTNALGVGVHNVLLRVTDTFSTQGTALTTLTITSGEPALWVPLNIGTTETMRAVHFINANEGWAAGYNGKILHTTNGGTDWTAQTTGTTQRFMSIRFLDANNGWAGAGRLILRTTDGGATWTDTLADPSVYKFRNSLFPVSATQAWATNESSGLPTHERWFSRYTVQGSSVVEEDFNIVASSVSFYDIFFTDPDNGWAVGATGPSPIGQIWRITNASTAAPEFTNQNPGLIPAFLYGIFMLDANNGWIVGSAGWILKTTDGGSSWAPLASGTTTNLRDVYFRNTNEGWVVGEGGLILATTDGGATWTPQSSGVTTTLWSVFFVNPGFIAGGDLAGGTNGVILKTVQGGTNTVAFSSGASNAAETIGTQPVVVTLTTSDGNPTTALVTVDYVTADGTAVAGGDYTAILGTVTFPVGSANGSTQTINVTILNDVAYEVDETFTVTLQNPAGATLGATSTHTVTIQSEDPLPTLTLNDNSITEGNAGTSQLTLTVYLSNPSGQTVTVNYATADGSAIAGSDYVALAPTILTFLPGETSKDIPITVNGDTAFEFDETFTLNLNNASNATISDSQGVGTITNDDAAPGNWTVVGSMATGRVDHAATLLQNGKVLVTGGYNQYIGYLTSAELYDPATGTWSATSSMNVGRAYQSATVLRDGRVLVAGGFSSSGMTNSAEIYDPVTETWSGTGNMNLARVNHTATLLNNGKVLAAGTYRNGAGPDTLTAELYDPATGVWTSIANMNIGRDDHAAVTLQDGRVLMVGCAGGGANPSTEIYDPNTGTWTVTGNMNYYRERPGAVLLPNGRVLVAGGFWADSTAEIYDPGTGQWTNTGSMAARRRHPNLTLLPNGKVLTTAGQGPNTAVELYDPSSGTWSLTSGLTVVREFPSTTMLADGSVLVAGGDYTQSMTGAEIYRATSGSWTSAASMADARFSHTTTLLPDGTVLVASGGGGGSVIATAERYNPGTGTWSSAGSLSTASRDHTATLLPNGKVLVAGGFNYNTVYARAELYNPAANSWALTGSMNQVRAEHGAMLLANGKVLVAGGSDGAGNAAYASAELYDLDTGAWSATGSMAAARRFATYTMLKDGRVLAAGGLNITSAEVYDPQTGLWNSTGSMNQAHGQHTATLLANGKVLVAGDHSGGVYCELYDPSTGAWTMTGSMNLPRYSHNAALLSDGRVLVAGGWWGSSGLNTSEIYDPATGQWTVMPNMNRYREVAGVTMLLDGRVLVTGGYWGGNGVELFDAGLGFNLAWRPVLTTSTSPLTLGQPLVATGSLFRGISEASSGQGRNSATNYPLLQLRSLINEEEVFLQVDATAGWSGTSFASRPVNNFPPGPAIATVFTNAIPSVSRFVMVSSQAPNQPPQANAGLDQTVQVGNLVTLDGSGSTDPDAGQTLAYAWSQVSGPAVTLTPNGAQATFTPTALGVYVFQLDVDDGHGGTDSDTVQVTVQDTTPPSVTVLRPNASGEKLFTGTPYTIEWSASDNGTLSFFDVFYSINGGGAYTPIAECTGVAGTARSCVWNSPSPTTTNGRIRVRAYDAAGNWALDNSNASYSVISGAGSITVTQPNTALNWALGSTQIIKWNHNLGVNSWVRIELSRDGGTTWELITASVKSNGSNACTYSWVVTGPLTTQGRVRVTWVNGPAVSDISNVNFNITNPTITVTQPNTNLNWLIGSSQQIKWNHNAGLGSTYTIAISRDGGVTFPEVVTTSAPATTATTGIYNWTVAAPASATARVRVTLTNNPVSTDMSNVNFIIANPTVTVTQPNTALNWAVGATQQIKWNHNLGMAATFTIELSRDGGANYNELITSSAPATTGTTGIYNWVVAGPATTQARVRVTYNLSSVGRDTSNVNFTIANPFISVSSPNSATTNWGYGTTQKLNWNTNLTSADRVNVLLSIDGGTTFPYTLASNLVASAKTTNVLIPTLGAPVTTARVRVEWIANPAIKGTNPINFKVQPPFITVTNPNLSTHVWTIGTTKTISWNQNLGAVERVLIELSLDGGATYNIILFASTPSDGSQAILVQSAWATTQGRVRITWLTDTSITDTSNQNFPIQ